MNTDKDADENPANPIVSDASETSRCEADLDESLNRQLELYIHSEKKALGSVKLIVTILATAVALVTSFPDEIGETFNVLSSPSNPSVLAESITVYSLIFIIAALTFTIDYVVWMWRVLSNVQFFPEAGLTDRFESMDRDFNRQDRLRLLERNRDSIININTYEKNAYTSITIAAISYAILFALSLLNAHSIPPAKVLYLIYVGGIIIISPLVYYNSGYSFDENLAIPESRYILYVLWISTLLISIALFIYLLT